MTTSLAVAQNEIPSASADSRMYVTMRIDEQLFGIDVNVVRDVLRAQKVVPIPLAPKEVIGSLNLRGRIVTVIDVRRRLGLANAGELSDRVMFVVVELKNELYSLQVDSVGEVMTVPVAVIEKTPANLSGSWKEVSSGIYKMAGELLVIIDVNTLLTLKS